MLLVCDFNFEIGKQNFDLNIIKYFDSFKFFSSGPLLIPNPML